MSTLDPVLLFVLFVSFTPCTSTWDTNESPEFACGDVLDGAQGVIESPLFPDPYPQEAECSWQVLAPFGHRIRLTSEYFSVEYQPDCIWDYVFIADGLNGEFGRALYCGSEQINFLSESNVTNIYFHSDVSGSDAGFRIIYEAVPTKSFQESTCNITLQKEGTVTSPGYPQKYPQKMECVYNLQAPPNYKIALEFVDFSIETTPCDFDKLEVYDGDNIDSNNLLGIFCGQEHPVTLTSSWNSMTLKFVSDESLQSQGFSAKVRFLPHEGEATTRLPATSFTTTAARSETTSAQDTSTSLPTASPTHTEGCNITITATSSNISSPNFPLEYPLGITCVTRLRSHVNNTFLITFTNFSIEEEENCDYDSLSIFQVDQDLPNGSTANHILLRRMCGNQIDTPIVSFEGRGLDLVFKSDASESGSGYLAHVVIAPAFEGDSCMAACENGGTCAETLLSDGAIDWMCICPEKYTGSLCETQVREACIDVKCLNNGVCQDDGVAVSCVCSNGYSGRFCEQFQKISEGGSLYFTKMVTNMTVSVGSSVILECAVNDPSAHVMWLFQDLIMTSTDWSTGVEVHPGGVVVISDVEDKHSGRYTCMAVTSDDLVERSMWIQLQEPCSLHVIKSPKNTTVREGQNAMFHCYVPDADVTLWRKDGDLVVPGLRKRILVNNYLVINSVIETDAGQYTCAARAKNGCFARVTAYLTVESVGHGKECGRPRYKPQDGGSGRISSGKEAPRGSAPWHVILREDKKDTTFCGGSLISPDTVLTAAHCVGQFETTFGYPFHPQHIQIYLGTHHCAGNNGIFRQVKSYILHEHFNDTHYNNDVAIFKLDSPIEYSDDVLPICLETPEFLEELLKPGHLGVITGCGSRYANGPVPTFLQEVQIPYVSREICRERAAVVKTNFTQGMFCAGYAKSMRGDACSGDSGGPYVLEFKGRYIQAGIVSWGVGCDRENHYGYYTSIAYYYNWIMDKLK